MKSLKNFIIEFIDNSKFSPVTNSKFLAGKNGPYQEPETKLRSMMNFVVLVEKFGLSNRYDSQISSIENYFDSDFTIGLPPLFRTSSKNQVNGLIGPSWTLEGLIALYKITNKKQYLEYCKSLADKYHVTNGIFVDILHCDGSFSGQDLTLNHQLWLASCLYNVYDLLGDVVRKQEMLDTFISLTKKDKTNRNGHLYHLLKSQEGSPKECLKRVIRPNYNSDMLLKEAGYHAFNLIACFINSAKITRSGNLEHLNKSLFSKKKIVRAAKNSIALDFGNKYSSSYNPVGIEYAAVFSHLNDIDNMIMYMNSFFNNYFDFQSMSVCNSSDTISLNSRVYELTYLSNNHIQNIYLDEKNSWIYKY